MELAVPVPLTASLAILLELVIAMWVAVPLDIPAFAWMSVVNALLDVHPAFQPTSAHVLPVLLEHIVSILAYA